MEDAVLDQSARVTRISAPVASPGNCAICGKTDHPEGFAATDNFDFEFYGTVYFCADCVGDYARVFGYLSQEQVEELKRLVDKQAEDILILRESVANLENILDAYSRLRGPIVSDDSSDNHAVNSSEVIAQPGSEGTQATVSGSQDGQGESTESVSVEGRNDVRDTTADDLFAELGL